MKLVDDWKEVLSSAWSIRLMAISALFSGLTVFLSLVNAEILGLSPIVFAAVSGAVNAFAMLARIITQAALSGKLRQFMRDQSGAIGRKGLAAFVAVSLSATAGFVGPWEGLRTRAYIDIVGVPTVCFGETRGVQLGDVYTPAECREMLEAGLGEFRADLGRCLKAKMPEGAAVAVLSWGWNVGTGAACRSTLVRRANRGDLYGMCDELLKWDKGRINGKLTRIRGLTNRRKAEHELCVRSLIKAGVPR